MVDGPDSAWRNRAPGPHAHRNTARQAMEGPWTEARAQQKHSNDPRQPPAHPQHANYWAPLMRRQHIPPHPAQPQYANDWAPRTQKRHQQGHRPQRPTQSSDPTQHAKGRTGDCPRPRKGATTRRNVTQGVPPPPSNVPPPCLGLRTHPPPHRPTRGVLILRRLRHPRRAIWVIIVEQGKPYPL